MSSDAANREPGEPATRRRGDKHRQAIMTAVRELLEEKPFAELPKVLALAAHANVAIKISGACTLSKQPYPFNDIWDPLAKVFDAWGFERCLWGTDWTRAYEVVNFAQAVTPFIGTDRLSESERAMLMGGACAKAYGWSPKK